VEKRLKALTGLRMYRRVLMADGARVELSELEGVEPDHSARGQAAKLSKDELATVRRFSRDATLDDRGYEGLLQHYMELGTRIKRDHDADLSLEAEELQQEQLKLLADLKTISNKQAWKLVDQLIQACQERDAVREQKVLIRLLSIKNRARELTGGEHLEGSRQRVYAALRYARGQLALQGLADLANPMCKFFAWTHG
jgi:hypothetical protein